VDEIVPQQYRYLLTPIQAASRVKLRTPVTCFGSLSEASSVAVSIMMSPQIILLSSLVLWGAAARQWTDLERCSCNPLNGILVEIGAVLAVNAVRSLLTHET